jgi:hypothetical protein
MSKYARIVAMALVIPACDTDPEAVSTSRSRAYPTQTTSGDVGPLADTSLLDDGHGSPPDGTADAAPPTDVPVEPPSDTAVADAGPDTAPGPVGPVDINAGFIGGACASAATCTYADATCLAAWPGGHCSKACDRFCPDAAGMATTFCAAGADVQAGAGGVCVQRCDFGKSPTGCRDGYTCRTLSRFNEPAVTAPVCVPGDAPPDVSDCIRTLIARGVDFELATNPMDSPAEGATEVCDVLDPVRVRGTINGINFRYARFDAAVGNLFVRCPVVLALWDMAELAKSRGVTDFTHLGTYNCRYIGGTTTLSEHGRANAIDISGMKLDDGSTYTLIADWERGVANPSTPGGRILRWLADAMHSQAVWNIILTPEFNSAHWDHFHLDLTDNAYFME